MKKVLIISASFLAIIIALFITLGCVKPDQKLSYTEPQRVIVYAKSQTALQNGVGDREFSSTSKTYRNIVDKTQEMFEVSMFDHAIHRNNVFL